MAQKVWGKSELQESDWQGWRVGRLELQIKRDEQEWIVGSRMHSRDVLEAGAEDNPSLNINTGEDESIDWHRYLVGDERLIHVIPALPNRPLVLKPAVRRRILPGRRAQFVFYIPVWLQLYVRDRDPKSFIAEFPTVTLSSTWFGDMQTGELCYSWETDLRQEQLSAQIPGENYSTCVLNVHNSSNTLLDFFRIAIHVEYLSLFSDGANLYTNEIYVNFSGLDQVSQVKYSSRGPKWIPGLQKVNEARETPSKNILKRSFYYIKQLAEI